ncbi:hypothetical protein H6F55_07035 [Phormidium sp. FACHB-322]|uniref:hypothetical protein n=1 Tax=Cyanophyceae TaxID=3028117 RepID=UPI0016879F0E|nr:MULTISPECIES: hypothetical protein [Cyanophyceae]MBD1917892.1 hypothetical protein [Phormidium sp. FACHB-77]MBD2029731.1 hypothetical protein [Phormidium sp. FACHB-322]MBD2052549.1 hypothetical protein [Leptolyngbya sp. FACHB-60]
MPNLRCCCTAIAKSLQELKTVWPTVTPPETLVKAIADVHILVLQVEQRGS